MHILPTSFKFLGDTATAFGETSITDFTFVGEYLSEGFCHCLRDCRTGCSGDALITLAMVVGTHIEERVVLSIVPTNQLVVGFLEGKERIGVLLFFQFLSLLHLCQEPTTGNDSVCLEKLKRCGSAHLGTNHTDQIFLHRKHIDGTQLSFHHNEAQCPTEGLRFLALPMEIDADSHFKQGE